MLNQVARLTPKNVEMPPSESNGVLPKKKRKTEGTPASRLKQLTLSEKKASVVLREVIQRAAVEYASKTNKLHPVFELFLEQIRVASSLLSDPQPGDTLPANPLEKLRNSVESSMKKFDEDEDLRTFFDEDLLHPIAYEAMVALNTIEGFHSPPQNIPSEKDIEKKLAHRQQLRERFRQFQQKRVEKEQKAAEKEAERQRAHQEAEALKKLLHQKTVCGIEDMQVPYAKALGFVAYEALPFETVDLFERSLRVWCFLVSLPQLVKMSQMPFSLFCHIIQQADENVIVEELVKGIVEALGFKNVISSRTRHWFLNFRDFVAERIGAKRETSPKKGRRGARE